MTQAVELTSSKGSTIPQAWVDMKKARMGVEVQREEVAHPPLGLASPAVWCVTRVYRVQREVVFDRGSNTVHARFTFLPE